MSQTIMIDPVTRLEGHGKITLKTNDAGGVEEAYFHVTQVRGFEKFCEGRPFYEMPCHHGAHLRHLPGQPSHRVCQGLRGDPGGGDSADGGQAARIAEPGADDPVARTQLFLSLFARPAAGHGCRQGGPQYFRRRKAMPELGRAGVQLRRFGQQIIEILGKKRIHPGWVVPGGVTEPLTIPKRDEILAMIPDACASIMLALDAYKQIADRFQEEAAVFANFPSMFLGMVTPEDGLEFTDGTLRLIDTAGDIVADGMDAAHFDQEFGEAVEPFTFMKFPYYRKLGYPEGCYRVGPLARLNLVSHTGTPLADAELREFKALAKGPVLSSFYYHYARLIEILHGIEAIERILAEPDILDTHVRATAGVNCLEGAGMAEAPRGTLMHHYKVDENGQMLWANLVIATGQNNKAMNRGILQVAQHYVDGNRLTDGMLNRVEAVIRTFDPCLSCSTHAYGQMPLVVELVDPDGNHLDERRRNG